MLIVILAVVCVLLAVVAVVLVRTLRFHPPAADASLEVYTPAEAEVAPDVLERLSGALSIPTISSVDYERTNFAPFDEFNEYLQTSFPLFHEVCSLEKVNDYALIYRWEGSEPALAPIALMAHYDVVPVEEGTWDDWTHPPFGGVVADGYIWGRGSLDIKNQLIAFLEAAENLMRDGRRPQRSIYFCFGHDEEVGGDNGAARVVEHLAKQGVRFGAVLDEGGLVISGAMGGVTTPMAVIGVAEKGHVDYEFSVKGGGGHSSTPPRHSSLGDAARLIARIEDHPLPRRLVPPVEMMMRNAAGEMGFVVRMALANLWLFRPLLLSILAKSPVTDAMIGTSCAATMAKASDAPNVLPQTTSFTVNVRLLPGDTVEGVRQHFSNLAGTIPVEIKMALAQEATPVSPAEGPFYDLLTRLTTQMYPNAIITPYLVMGGTDSRRFYALSDHVYRFTPIWVANEERAGMHGTNERLSVINYARLIHFFELMMGEL
jgi:carboxypeptidase PM20D1